MYFLRGSLEGSVDRVHQVGGPGVGILGLPCRGVPATGWLTFTSTAIQSGVLKNMRTTHSFRPPTLDNLLTNSGNIAAIITNNRSSA